MMQSTIIAASPTGAALYRAGGSPTLSCCDIYGNAGGDWVGCIAGQLGVNGNICEDPLFCDSQNLDFTLYADSPCAHAERQNALMRRPRESALNATTPTPAYARLRGRASGLAVRGSAGQACRG